jgi:hypothetical protein
MLAEAEVVRRSGLSVEMIRQFRRRLTPGVHYVSAPVRYTVEGMSALGIMGVKLAEAEEGAVPCERGAVRVTRVYPTKRTHCHFMEVEMDGAVVTVRVQNASRFLPGMEIERKDLVEAHGCLDYVGRLPRERGRW